MVTIIMMTISAPYKDWKSIWKVRMCILGKTLYVQVICDFCMYICLCILNQLNPFALRLQTLG